MGEFNGYDELVGFLLHDERLAPSTLVANDGTASNSSYAEGGRRPGRGVFQQADVAASSSTAGRYGNALALDGLGDQADATYDFAFLAGGLPGEHARAVWRRTTDESPTWMGYQTHNVVQHVEHGTLLDTESSPAEGVNLGSCPTADGRALFVYATAGYVRCRVWDPSTRSFGSVVTIADSSATMTDDAAAHTIRTDALLVDAVKLPTGRLLVFGLTADVYATAAGPRTLWQWFSDDNGATWRSGSYLAIDPVVDVSEVTVEKLRAEYYDGSVLLVLGTKRTGEGQVVTYHPVQYASTDAGHNFRRVQDWADQSLQGRFPEVVVDRAGVFTVVYWKYGTGKIERRRVAAAGSPLLSAAPADVATVVSTTCLAAWADDAGALRVAWTDTAEVELAVSDDGGDSWREHSTEVFNMPAGQLDRFDVVAVAGRSVWAVCDPNGSLTDHKYLICETGGWSSVVQPRVAGEEPLEQRGFGSGSTWLPFRLPTATFTGSGRSLQTVAPYGVRIATTAAQGFHTEALTTTPGDGHVVYFPLTCDAGGSLTATHVGVELDLGTAGVEDYRVAVRASTTQVRLVDVNGGATVATLSLGMTTRRWFKLALRKRGTTSAAVALYTRDDASDEWALVASSTSITQRSGASAAASELRHGHIVATTSTSTWGAVMHHAASGAGDVGGWFDDLALDPSAHAPWGLYGALVPAAPHRLWVDQGLHVVGSAGPATRGDRYLLAPEHDRPVEHLHPQVEASPSVWAQLGTGATQRILWEPSGEPTHPGSPSWGLAAFGWNVPSLDLLASNGGTPTVVATLDFTHGLSGLPFLRVGDTLEVDTTTAFRAGSYVEFDELVGCTVDLGSGVLRKVVAATEGAWTDEETRRPVLTIEITGGEPTSGTLDVWRPDGFVVVHDDLTKYTRFGLERAAGPTVDGHVVAGTILLGPVVVFGNKYSQGRVRDLEPRTEVAETRTGRRSVRELGPPQRVVTASWVEGFDTTPTYRDQPVPDFVAAAVEPLAARGDDSVLRGILRRTRGGELPVGYLPRIRAEDVGGTMLSRGAGRRSCVLGRLVDTVSRTAPLGDEGAEVVTMAGLRLLEEV